MDIPKTAEDLFKVKKGLLGVSDASRTASRSWLMTAVTLTSLGFAFSKMSNLGKDMSETKNPLARLSSKDVQRNLGVMRSSLSKLNEEIVALSKNAEGVPEIDIRNSIEAAITAKKRQAVSLGTDINDQQETLNTHTKYAAFAKLGEALNPKDNIGKELAVSAAGFVTKKIIGRWYEFNELVKENNTDLGLRTELYTQANNQEIALGHSVSDTAALYEVARKNGLIYGRTILPELKSMLTTSQNMEDALKMQPEEIGEVLAASKRISVHFEDAAQAISTMNQRLGISGKEASALFDQVSQLNFEFSQEGVGGVGVTKDVAKMGLLLKGIGIDPQAALKVLQEGSHADVGSSVLTGAGPSIAGSPQAFEAFIKTSASRLGMQDIAKTDNPVQDAFSQQIFTDWARQLGFSLDTARTIQAISKQMEAHKDWATPKDEDETESLAQQAQDQIKLTGDWNKVLTKAWGDLQQAFRPLMPYVSQFTGWLMSLSKCLSDLSEGTKNAIKWVAGLTALIVGVGGLVAFGVVVKNLTTAIIGIARIIPLILAGLRGGLVGGAVDRVAGGVAGGVGRGIVLNTTGGLLDQIGKPLMTSAGKSLPVVIADAVYNGFLGVNWTSVGKLLGGVGAVAAVGVLAYELGTLIDQKLGISDKVAKAYKDDTDTLGMGETDLTSRQSGTNVYAAQKQLAERFFSSDNLTVNSGKEWLQGQETGLKYTNPEAVRAIHDMEARTLEKQLEDLKAREEASSGEQRKALEKKVEVMVELLKVANQLKTEHLNVDKKDISNSEREKFAARTREEHMAFISRSYKAASSGEDIASWNGGAFSGA